MKLSRYVTVVAFAVILSCTVAYGSVGVTNLSLEKNSQFTEFTIHTTGEFDFSHQIVPAKADKPFRIVVDIKDALHRLPQYSFEHLPAGSVQRIRTSQFSVNPENTVRVVLDVSGTLTYKVKKSPSAVTLMINTPREENFARWEATLYEPPVYAGVNASEPEVEQPVAEEKVAAVQPVNMKQAEKVETAPASVETPVVHAEKAAEQAKLLAEIFSSSQQPEQETVATPVKKAKAKEEHVQTDWQAMQAIASASVEQEKAAEASTTVKQEKKQTAPAIKKTEPESSVKTNATTDQVQLKHADSALQPQAEPEKQLIPLMPEMLQKAPRHQKTTLPETKASKKPLLAESAGTVEKQQAGPESRTDAIRRKYGSGAHKIEPEQLVSEPSAALAEAEETKTFDIDDKIARIREKYKRGIKFVQDDEDERRLASVGSFEKKIVSRVVDKVGAYSEYLPQRDIVIYTSNGRRDPFAPLVQESMIATEKSELPDVETLRLVGILQDAGMSRALFEDFNGYGYILKAGDRVKNGFVVSITEGRVVFQIRQYGWNRRIALELEEEF